MIGKGGERREMRILRRHLDKRGVSIIIAALLLIAIAVAAAVLLYVFSIGLIGGLQGGGGQQTKQQLIMEAYNWIGAGASFDTTFRNVGSASVDVGAADYFVNGLAATMGGACVGLVLDPQDSCEATITPDGSVTITSGVAYTLKIVTPDGAVFSYSVVAGQAGIRALADRKIEA
jgi:FlaG/FlaF family flagellin (archaellin)